MAGVGGFHGWFRSEAPAPLTAPLAVAPPTKTATPLFFTGLFEVWCVAAGAYLLFTAVGF